MTRLLNVHLDATVRLELPDDHPYFTTGRDGSNAGIEENLDIEMELIEEAQSVLSDAYVREGEARQDAIAKIVYSDASVEDVTGRV
jgi:hypothetical protein